MTGSPFPQEKDIIMATNHLPLSLSIVQKNEKQTSFSVSTSGFLVQSVEAVKIKDHPLFQPLNMKRASKDIIFKSKDIFKPVNLDQQKTLLKPVAMVRPLPLAVVKPIKKGESFIKPFSEESLLIAAPEKENVVSKNPESDAKNENDIKMQESNELSKPSALNVTIPENQCQDCLKVMTTKRSVIEHKSKFRCPVNRFDSLKTKFISKKDSISPDSFLKNPNEDHEPKREETLLLSQNKKRELTIGEDQISSEANSETGHQQVPRKKEVSEKRRKVDDNSLLEDNRDSISKEERLFPTENPISNKCNTGRDEQTFKCDDCGLKFSKGVRLKKHKQKSTCKSLQCDLCGFISNRAYDLKKHKTTSNCKRLSNGAEQNLIQDIDAKNSNVEYSEEFEQGEKKKGSKVTSSSDETVQNSTEKRRDRQPSEIVTFKCENCNKTFRQSFRLKAHKDRGVCKSDSVGILSAKERSFGKCDKCGYKARFIFDLRRHKKRQACKMFMKKRDIVTKKEHCPKETRSEKLSNKKCDRSGFQSFKQSSLRKHKIRNDSDGPKGEILSSIEIATGKCDNCNYKTQRKYDLRMHKKRRCCLRNKVSLGEILSSIEIATSKCDNCDYKTQRKSDLRMHKARRSCLRNKVTTCKNSDISKNKEMVTASNSPLVENDMLDSTIEDLMKEVNDQQPRVQVGQIRDVDQVHDIRGDSLEGVSEINQSLVVCGFVSTPSGKVFVVRPINKMQKVESHESGLAKLRKLTPRLFKRDVTLSKVIEATRLPPPMVFMWIQALQLSLPPE